jgi:hypothetical protein
LFLSIAKEVKRLLFLPKFSFIAFHLFALKGYDLPKIIEKLKKIDADIFLLQELDWGCERTKFKNVCKELADALDMNYMFVCEFVEIQHPDRGTRLQGIEK